jgi:CHAT domain-containing protein/tetratricopeptide (TPR) repeat protein
MPFGLFRGAWAALALGLAVLIPAGHEPALAQSFEQIRETCRESVRPQVQSCMQAKKGTGDRESNLEACKKSVEGAMRACVMQATQRAAAGKAAPRMPELDGNGKADSGSVPAVYVAPPRNIADITAILDSEKPDPAKIAKLKADADAGPPKGAAGTKLAQFYYDRANARALLARNQEALADAQEALKAATEPRQVTRIRQFIGQQHRAVGDLRAALAAFQAIVRDGDQPGRRGSMINASRHMAQTFVRLGDIPQADAYARRVAALVQEARGSPHPSWRATYAVYGSAWESDADAMRGLVFESRGQYREAEMAYRRAAAFRRASLKMLPKFDFPPPPEQVLLSADASLLDAARMLARQGRLSEAEADARRALLAVLKHHGKYNPQTRRFILGLASILIEQGRYEEAEKLTRYALEVNGVLGVAENSEASVSTWAQLALILISQRKLAEAAAVYASIEKAISDWEPGRREEFMLSRSRVTVLYATGQVAEGIAVAQELVKRQTARKGENHIDTAAARGTLAVGYARAGRAADAIREFKASIPILMAAIGENPESDDPSAVLARQRQLQNIVEAYIGVLARNTSGSSDVAAETFSLADAVRSQSVQRAVVASSARMATQDPALAELVRGEQDLGKQIGAQLGVLNNALSLPSDQRDDSLVRALNATINELRASRQKAQQEIKRRFPAYANLIDPKPPTLQEIRAALRDGEALLSYYFGNERSFVWAVPKSGPVAFAVVPMTALQLEAKVRRLRGALEPNAAMLSDIPAFDLALAHELYAALLAPVAEAWKPAGDLIVVTNGALGLLPLSLLPMALSTITETEVPFAAYRAVPWLVRTHAVTTVPSVAALQTLRALPPGKSSRDKLIGFGDPLFSVEQAAEADKPVEVAEASATVTRGFRGMRLERRSTPQLEEVDSAQLAMLPRLPDTADELKAIAAALEADPKKALFLGKEANERKVKASPLERFRILAFATHGLVPGDLDGLVQPALALSAPEVADSGGDGLLTMEEILTLKLDADWVVLSACNTGSGAGAGAEAASGLGRAFFYAGTRALLVTNWSVHSASARDLVSDLFRRQASDPGISRGEALRQAMLALMDGPGFPDGAGGSLFSYAHPLFWAPYTIIGDGGRS